MFWKERLTGGIGKESSSLFHVRLFSCSERIETDHNSYVLNIFVNIRPVLTS